MPRSMSDPGWAYSRAYDPPSATARTPRIAPSRCASDDTSSRCSGESCFTFKPFFLSASLLAFFFSFERALGRQLVARQLALRERTNRDVVSVRVPERELLCSSIRVRVRLLFEPGDERACPFQGHIEIVDAEEQ